MHLLQGVLPGITSGPMRIVVASSALINKCGKLELSKALILAGSGAPKMIVK
jgi:hypothetical protein